MSEAETLRPAPWKSRFRRLRLFIEIVGTLTTACSVVLPAIYGVYEYRSSCEAKGQGLFICIGGSLGLVDVDKLHQKDLTISALQAELGRARIEIARRSDASPQLASATSPDPAPLAAAQAALKEATEGLKQRDAKIADLTEKFDRLTARYTALLRNSGGAGPSAGSSGGTGSKNDKVPAGRPDPTAISTTVWPSGTLPHGETRRATTQHGTLQCTGGNTNTGAPRSCVWLP